MRTHAAGLAWDLYRVPRSARPSPTLDWPGCWRHVPRAARVASPRSATSLAEGVFLPAIDALEPLVVERTPLPSGIGYLEQDVTFPGGAADVTLAGTPHGAVGAGPHPAVVLMSGSGPQDRDESLPGMTLKPFALVADALGRAGRRGPALRRPRDRASSGDYGGATLADFTADGAAALAWLREQAAASILSRIGVLGHSEGGAYIASIAADGPDVAFVVGLAPMVRPGIELMLDQTYAIGRSQGLTEEQAQASVDANRRLYEAALRATRQQLELVVREVFGDAWDGLHEATRRAAGRSRLVRRADRSTAQLPALTSPWFQSLLRSDPSADWARVDGARARRVRGQGRPGHRGARVGRAGGGARRAGRSHPAWRCLPMRTTCSSPRSRAALEEYPTLEQTFTPELLPLVTECGPAA